MTKGFDWDLGIGCFSEFDADGFLGVSVARYGEDKSSGAPIEILSPFGFASRPMDPDVDATGQPTMGCSVLYATEGDKLHGMLGTDPRYIAKLPEIKKGEAYMYGSAGQFIRCHTDGAISLFTTDDGTPAGRSIYVMISPQEGFVFSSPWGGFSFGPSGFHVAHISGAAFDAGAISGLISPFDTLSSYVKMHGAMASVSGSAVSLGTDGGATNLAAVTALTTLLNAIGLAISTFVPGPSAAFSPTSLAAVAAALSAFDAVGNNIGKVV